MTRTRLSDRILPAYTRGEELFNMISHIAGAALGVAALVLCVIVSAVKGDAYGVVSGAVYGSTMILLYAISSIYHGLTCQTPKKVMQILDHCTIYFLIGGTYTPILLTAIRRVNPSAAWMLFGLVWGLAALATVLTAVDLKKYSVFSMICYIGMGWCIVLAPKALMTALPVPGLVLLFAGGIVYTIGAVLYGVGKKHRYMHSVFHLFVLAGSILQLFCILFYVL